MELIDIESQFELSSFKTTVNQLNDEITKIKKDNNNVLTLNKQNIESNKSIRLNFILIVGLFIAFFVTIIITKK
jgi:hypothetical protein